MQKLAPSPSQQGFPPHGLISLWDMIRFHGEKIVSALNTISTLQSFLGKTEPSYLADAGNRNFVFNEFDQLHDQLMDLGLSMSAKQAERVCIAIRQSAQGDVQTRERLIKRLTEELAKRLEDEIDGKVIYYIGPRASFIEEPFARVGSAALDMFPGAAEEIENASRCIAFQQGTASVFHLMRAMETAVQVLSTHLGIGNVNREWGKLLSDAKTKIEALPKGDIRDEWSACHSNLYHVKQAWRNNTMHPKKTYTPEQSEEVFHAVCTFMKQLATLVSDPEKST